MFFQSIKAAHVGRRTQSLPDYERPKSMPLLTELDTYADPKNMILPTPEQQIHYKSKQRPSGIVSIDMFSFSKHYRGSQRSIEQRIPLDSNDISLTNSRRRKLQNSHPGLAFSEIGFSRVMRHASRERWERAQSVSSMNISSKIQSRRSRSREKKKHSANSCDNEHRPSRSCSLRRSFKSLFYKDKEEDMGDLWAEGKPKSPCLPIVSLSLPPFKRSHSLPRSLHMSRVIQNFNNKTPALSASTDGHLDKSSDLDFIASVIERKNLKSLSQTSQSSLRPKSTDKKLTHLPSIRRCRSSSWSLKMHKDSLSPDAFQRTHITG